MSAKSRAGKAAWMQRGATYQQRLTDRISATTQGRMSEWEAQGRIPLRVRVMARFAGRPLRLPSSGTGR